MLRATTKLLVKLCCTSKNIFYTDTVHKAFYRDKTQIFLQSDWLAFTMFSWVLVLNDTLNKDVKICLQIKKNIVIEFTQSKNC